MQRWVYDGWVPLLLWLLLGCLRRMVGVGDSIFSVIGLKSQVDRSDCRTCNEQRAR